MNTLPPENQLLKYEEQYEAAGWETTLRAMALAGKHFKQEYVLSEEEKQLRKEVLGDAEVHEDVGQERKRSIGSLGVRLCLHAELAVSSIVPMVKTLSQIPKEKSELYNSGLYLNTDMQNIVAPQLQMTHILYHSPEDIVASAIADEVNLSRLDKNIDFYAKSYANILVSAHHEGISVASKIKNIARDSTFFIGYEDTCDASEKTNY